jgi:excinuclease UvrABC nuclease subunit
MLAARVEFNPAQEGEIFAALPSSAAVFLLRGDAAAEPYLNKTANLRQRMERLLGVPTTPGKKLNLRERVRSIEYTATGSDFESRFLLYKVLREIFPYTYQKRLRLRFAPLIRLQLENRFPRALVTRRWRRQRNGSLYYGPFQSRAAAEKFANDALDFFKMRRCVEELNPDPKFPGCVYSEMKMCLAPCFRGSSDEEYQAEVARVQAFLDTSGSSLVKEISAQRDQASANLEFESAAALHARLDKLKPLLAQLPEIVQRIDRLRAAMVQRSAEPGSVALFSIEGGAISEPVAFPIQASEHTKSQSMEARLEAALDSKPAGHERDDSHTFANPANSSRGSQTASSSAISTMEHLALLRRWYYRGRRSGEIFFADDKGVLPLRRIVRGIARVYRGEREESAAPEVTSGEMGVPEESHEDSQDK